MKEPKKTNNAREDRGSDGMTMWKNGQILAWLIRRDTDRTEWRTNPRPSFMMMMMNVYKMYTHFPFSNGVKHSLHAAAIYVYTWIIFVSIFQLEIWLYNTLVSLNVLINTVMTFCVDIRLPFT